MHRILVLLISCLLLPIVAAGQATTRIAIRAGQLIDGRGEKPLEIPLIQVEGDKIIHTGRFSRHATRGLRYHTALSRCATWKPKERCTRM